MTQAYDELVSGSKSLSTKLKEMGFSEDTFMVVHKYDRLDVADGYDDSGYLKKNEYLSFNPEKSEQQTNGMYRLTFDRIDDQIASANHGPIPAGGLGSNNGVYTAKAFKGQEMIITKDADIYQALRRIGFAENTVDVPLSNGGTIMDIKKESEFKTMEMHCKIKANLHGIEKRTAAVQRGDIVTTYDPNDKDSGGFYRNIRHYEKQPNGEFKSISMEQASQKLNLAMHYSSNESKQVDAAQKVDAAVMKQAMNNKIRY